MYWYPLQLFPPCHPDCGERTRWLPGAKKFFEAHKNDERALRCP